MACDTLLPYPYFNETFSIHTDASDFQLGAVLRQKRKRVSSHSIKLIDSHQMYIITEKELLSIVEAIKELITILLCQILIIYTDKKTFLVKKLLLIECLDGD